MPYGGDKTHYGQDGRGPERWFFLTSAVDIGKV